MKPSLTVTVDHTDEVIKSIYRLIGKRVAVGVMRDQRMDGGIGNAALGYIHEHGAPEVGVPPHPHLVPGIQSVQMKWMAQLRWAGVETLNGKTPDARLEQVGQIAVEGIRAYVQAGVPPPLLKETLARRKGNHTQPLIASGEYLQSIDYQIVVK